MAKHRDDFPPGVYEDITTETIEQALADYDPTQVVRRDLDPAEAPSFIGNYLWRLFLKALESKAGTTSDSVRNQVAIANQVIETLQSAAPDAFDDGIEIADSRDLLLAVLEAQASLGLSGPPERPQVPLTNSALLVNGRDQPRVGAEILREIQSSQSVDLLSAFIKWHGFRLVREKLEQLTARGGRLRVITTTYMGATDRKALDALIDIGAEVRVSYETRTTRLHAKAWLFTRARLSTAYVGSSNLSKAAMTDGLEWNVRLSSAEQPHLLETFRATFDDYWNDPSFEPYTKEDGDRFEQAIKLERRGDQDLPIDLVAAIDVHPYPYQREILEQLAAERAVHNRWHSLVVMATGTGKTVVSALDYRELRRVHEADTLLFVAHREELLRQALTTFRTVLRQGDFGEQYVGGQQPKVWRHVFASIQSLANLNLDELAPTHFSMVIVDEFHRAEAPTYDRLLSHLDPKILLGLTATPERTDGQDVTKWFDGRIAVELRVWEALDRGLLSPFQYFGIADDVDLSAVAWRRGRYDPAELGRMLAHNEARAAKIVESVIRVVAEPSQMRALGFCVSVDHAHFMAEYFRKAGFRAIAIDGQSADDVRRGALRDLANGDVQVVFAVDLLNEGIDVPAVDTILFLRPTESATLFLQQLGRGLRHADGKACLTVLDFIGNQHARFRFDRRFRALAGGTRRRLAEQIESGFPYLPAGCHIELDRVAQQTVLTNVRRQVQSAWKDMATDLANMGQKASLRQFLEEAGFELEELYAGSRGGWLALRRRAGLEKTPDSPIEQRAAAAIRRLLHVDDGERLSYLRDLFGPGGLVAESRTGIRNDRLGAMVRFGLWGPEMALDQAPEELSTLLQSPARHEVVEVLQLLDERRNRVTKAVSTNPQVPLALHARYRRDEILAAFGDNNPSAMRQGVKYIPGEQADILLVTLNKSERHFTPSTMYRDRALTPTLFQWESQSTTSVRSSTGQRYLHHRERGSSVHLFVRVSKETDEFGAAPFLYAGPATYRSHRGDRPIEIQWELEHELPADIFQAARAVAG